MVYLPAEQVNEWPIDDLSVLIIMYKSVSLMFLCNPKTLNKFILNRATIGWYLSRELRKSGEHANKKVAKRMMETEFNKRDADMDKFPYALCLWYHGLNPLLAAYWSNKPTILLSPRFCSVSLPSLFAASNGVSSALNIHFYEPGRSHAQQCHNMLSASTTYWQCSQICQFD